MARYTRIHLGPARRNDPQVREAVASTAITPGSLIVLSSGEFALAGAATIGKVWLAQENYLAQKSVDDAYAADNDTVIGLEMEDGTHYAVRVATGVNITAVGTALTPGANGTLAIASTDDLVVAYSDEIYNNDTGSAQLVRIRPAASASYLTAAA